MLGEGILDSGDEEAGDGGDAGGFDSLAHRVFGLVDLFCLVFRGHCEDDRVEEGIVRREQGSGSGL